MRTIYWARAINVWEDHKFAGAGAGSFAEAQLRYRDEAAQGRHAHGYIHQTLADLGLLGLVVSLVALVAWLRAAGRTLGVRPRARGVVMAAGARWDSLALALVAVVFGVHSALDWTWFVPAVAVTGLFCAGWVAGRGPCSPARLANRPQPRPGRSRSPRCSR